MNQGFNDVFFNHIAGDTELHGDLAVRQAVQSTEDEDLLAAVR